MSDEKDLEEAVRRFLRDAETAYDEYEEGYVDPDATLRVLRSHIDHLASQLD